MNKQIFRNSVISGISCKENDTKAINRDWMAVWQDIWSAYDNFGIIKQ